MKIIIVIFLMLLPFCTFAQTELLSPTGDGGFETGTSFAANGWTVVNAASNIWEVGTAATQYAGSRGVYVANPAGTYAYTTGTSRTSHFYRDIAIPSGATSVTLSFYWKGKGESGWDRMLVYTAPTTVTPVANTPASSSTTITGATLRWTQPAYAQTTYTQATITGLDALAGTTVRFIFTWQNDNSAGTSPGAAVDNISLTCSLPAPMTYTSSTTTQNSSNVAVNSTNNQIIGLQVVTSGSLSPLDLTSIAVNTNGSNSLSDITNVKCYYTGTSSTFATTTQFGTTQAAAASLTFTGTQTLSAGPNYFWITYDIPVTATAGNVVDAECTQITLGGSNYAPTITAPAGNRMIEIPPVIIGTASTTNQSLPIEPYYGYTFSQSIYDQTEVGAAGQISKIGWNYTGGSWTDNIVIYMANTTKTTYSGTTDWVASGSLTQVYSGPISVGSGWVEITLTTPFNYDGSSNLLIAVDENTSGYHSSSDEFYNTFCTGNKSIVYYSDGTNPDPSAPPTASGIKAYRPNVRLYIAPKNMEYNSSTCTQHLTSDVNPGSVNNQILCLKVVTDFPMNPLSLTSININTNGTTSLTDLSNIKIYYTGNTSAFTATNQFGSTLAPAASLVFNGTQTLLEDTNYFWVSYDVAGGAVSGNHLDAECTQFTLNGINQSPTVSAPAGFRPVASDMSISSVTCSQVNTADIYMPASNNELLCIRVGTSGSLNPIALTNLIMNMTGSTNPLTDVSSVKIYYTGNSSVFATGTPFGSGSAPSTGNITFTGSQILLQGSNYFWIAYDVPSSATAGNYTDAECSEVTFSGATGSMTPAVTAPAGNRQIINNPTCEHTITMYDEYNSSGFGTPLWDGASVDVLVNGVAVLSGVKVNGETDNGNPVTFMATHGDEIRTVWHSAGSSDEQCFYRIEGKNRSLIFADGSADETFVTTYVPDPSNVPTGKTGYANCLYVPKFTVNHDSYRSPVSDSCFVMSEYVRTQAGSVWSNFKVNLNNDLDIEFSTVFGGVDGGADGIMFVFQGECASAGGDGSGLGFTGIVPSFGVEFDAFQNSGAPTNDNASDHVSFFRDGVNDHGTANEIGGAATLVGNLENGAARSIRVVWTSATNLIEVYLDGVLTRSATIDMVNSIFGGSPEVYWGFTGSTGWNYNKQTVCVTQFPSINLTTQLIDDTIAPGNSVQNSVEQGASAYLWSPDNGTINSSTIYNPVMSPDVTTTYYVTITDACGNDYYDNVTVYVESTLPVGLASFNASCKNEGILLSWATYSETNNDYFTIERSHDLLNFIPVTMIDGAGNSNQLKEYNATDYESESEINYYRLKQTDFDGSISYSEIVSADCNQNLFSINIFPNPVWEHIDIYVNGVDIEKIKVSLFNSLGQEFAINTSTHSNIVSVSFTEKIPPGHYIIKVSDDQNIKTCKFLKM